MSNKENCLFIISADDENEFIHDISFWVVNYANLAITWMHSIELNDKKCCGFDAHFMCDKNRMWDFS